MKIVHTREWFNINRNTLLTLKGATQCQNCANKGTQLHHIVPLVVGGTNNISNLALLCDECHGKVHGKTFNTELQRIGIERAKAEGKYKGRPQKYTVDCPQIKQAVEMYLEGQAVTSICSTLKISKRTFYRRIRELEIVRGA